jgi:alkyl hydroperoxide reductase subunit AhpC
MKQYDNEFYVTGAKVGKPAPKFEMEAVMPDGTFDSITLDQYLDKGKWVILYFYPLDFTFVCPTEIKEFNKLTEEFKKLNTELIACSTDSVFSHLAWQNSPELEKLHHVHASDNNHKVSEAYGVLDDEKGVAWRGTFIIDPKGVLKSAYVNHGEAGRNVDEVLRTLQVFQAEERGEMVPCGWQPGDDFL